MASSSSFAALLGRSHRLDGGIRVRLRLARSSDAWAIGRLLAAHGEPDTDQAQGQLMGLVRYDPRDCCLLCATALIDGREALVGVGSIAFGRPGPPCPDLLVVDPELGEDLRELLDHALVSRAEDRARRRAA